MLLKRALTHLFIAATLLLAQQGALSHAIAHALFEHSQPAGDSGGSSKGKLPHSIFCAHWLSYNGLHGASAPQHHAVMADAACFDYSAHYYGFSPAQVIRAFQSRAPPVLL
jgi:hypothetical protein